MNDGLLLSSPILRRGCPWGIAVVAGTGSVVVGVKVVTAGKVQQIVRRGGQGHLLGDHGSGKFPIVSFLYPNPQRTTLASLLFALQPTTLTLG
jgi:hypothetical protein